MAMLDAVRIGITTLALLTGLTILGLAGNALAVYNATRLQDAVWLSLWPAAFDLRPTVALVVGSSLVTLANIAGLLCSKVPHVSLSHSPFTLLFLKERKLTHIPPDPQQHPPPHAHDVRRAAAGLRGRPGGHHLLLRRQRLHHSRHAAQLDVPMERRVHERRAALWLAVPLELGVGRAGRDPRPARGGRAVRGGLAG